MFKDRLQLVKNLMQTMHDITLIFRQWLFCRQNADGNGLAVAIVPPVQSLVETK